MTEPTRTPQRPSTRAQLTLGLVLAVVALLAGVTTAAVEAAQPVGKTLSGVDFTWSPLSPKIGQTVQFTDTSSGSPSRWSWDFGDGGTSSLQNPTHVFSSSGSKTVTLVVTTPLGLASGSNTVEVQAGGTTPCVANAKTLCLLGDRFRVRVDWHDQYNDRDGDGRAVPSTDRTGFFWFFDQNNVELVVKVLDGGALNGHFWFFYGALSDVEYTIRVTDTATGSSTTYRNQAYNICGLGDTEAFPSSSKSGAAGATAVAERGAWERGGWLAAFAGARSDAPAGVEGANQAQAVPRRQGPASSRQRPEAQRESLAGPLPPYDPDYLGARNRAQRSEVSASAGSKALSISTLRCEYLGVPLASYHGADPTVWVQLYSVDESRWLSSNEFSYTYDDVTSTFTVNVADGEYSVWLVVDADGDGRPNGPWDFVWHNYRTLPTTADHWFARFVPLTAPVSSYSTYEAADCDHDGFILAPGQTSFSWGAFPEASAVEEVIAWFNQEGCASGATDYQEVSLDAAATSTVYDLWADAEIQAGVQIRGASSIYGDPINIGLVATYYTRDESSYYSLRARLRTSSSGTGPTALFEFSPGLPEVGESVQFTDLSTGSPSSWSWDFGDGGTSTQRNPTHTFAAPGAWDVSLTVANAYGSDTTVQSVPVQSGVQTTCGNAYYDNGEAITAFWFGGGMAGDRDHMYGVLYDLSDFGYTAGETELTGFCAGNSLAFSGGPWPNEVFVYADAGGVPDDSRVLAQGTIVTGDGTGDSVVTLSTPLLLNGDFWLVNRGDPKHDGEDFNMEFDSGPASGNSYLSSSGIAGLVPAEGGNYILRASLREAVTPSPTADFSFSPSYPKVSETVQFTDLSTGSPTAWRWDFGDGATSNARNPKHAYSTTGTKTVKLTATNQYGQDTVSKTIDVRAFAECQAGGQTLCLLKGRFQVEVDWHDQYNNQDGVGHALVGTDRTGYFWFFNQANIELLVKVLDGRALNGHFWVFYGALSDVEYWIEVTDMESGASKTYYNQPSNICGSADTEAF